jgi:rod shape-determining protein MreD
MVKKILLIFISFYILFLLQTSFLVHFNILGRTPNLILISVILINLFEKPREDLGLYSAVISGLFLDMSSQAAVAPLNFIGFHILTYLLIAIFIKFLLKKYVQI